MISINPTGSVNQTTKWSVIILIGLICLCIPVTFLRNIPFIYLILGITAIIAFPFILQVEKIICLLTFYMIAFGVPMFKGNLYPLPVIYFLIDIGVVFLFLLLIGEYCLQKREESYRPYFGWAFLVYFFFVAIAFACGLYYENNIGIIQRELRILCYYGVYFIAVNHFRDIRWIKFYFLIIITAVLMSAFDYIYTFNALAIFRFVTRQIHMFLLVAPFLVSVMVLDRKIWRKCLAFILLVPIGASVIISQTRGTWVSMVIAVLLAAGLSFFSKAHEKHRFFSIVLAVALLGFVVILNLKLIRTKSEANVEFVETRVESVSNLQTDYSLMMRANSYLTILKKIKAHPWFGNGLGDTATYKFFGQYSTQNNVDSTYLTLLWKMGIGGLITLLILYFLLLRKAFFIFRNETELFFQIFSIGMLSAFSAFIILGVISPVLITYRFNFIFGVLFAITEVVANKVKQNKKQNFQTN